MKKKEHLQHLLSDDDEQPRPHKTSINNGDEKNLSFKERLKKKIAFNWTKMKIPMVIWMIIIAICLVGFILGCVWIARAGETTENLKEKFGSSIDNFIDYLPTFEQAHFIGKSKDHTFNLDKTSDPYYDKIVEAYPTTDYPSLVFSHSLSQSPIPIPSSEKEIAHLSIIFNSLLPTPSSFVISTPLWKIEKTTMSLSKLSVLSDKCEAEGGRTDPNSNICFQYYLISNICLKVTETTKTGYQLDDSIGGIGCHYPFDEVGQFVPVKYSVNGTFFFGSNDSIPVYVRSSEDPYVILEHLTKGSLNFQSSSQVLLGSGFHLLLLAMILTSLASVFGTILFIARRKVKREMKADQGFIVNTLTRPPVFRYLSFSVASFGVALGIGLPLIGHWSERELWTISPFAGLIIVIVAFPLAIITLMIFWSFTAKTIQWKSGLKGMMLVITSLLVIAMCVAMIVKLVKPWRHDFGTDGESPDNLQAFIGIFACLALLPLAILNLFIAYQVFLRKSNQKYSLKSWSSFSSFDRFKEESGSVFDKYGMICIGLSIFVICFFATTFLPPIWDQPLVGYYDTFISEYSIIPNWSIFTIIVKLYDDVVAFYGFIAVLVIVSVLSSYNRRIYSFMHYWIRIPLPFVKMNLYTTIGELLFLGMVTSLTIWWIYFWGFDYGRIAKIENKIERCSRTLGHLTNLYTSLLIIPVTRNSLWVQLIGIPFERTIRYHRWAGIGLLVAVTAHMISWWVNWSITYQALWYNIISLQNMMHTDNWTMPMVEIAWLGLMIMGLFSLPWFRRNRFELFYYSHHFFLVFFVAALIHSWALWYFLSGGLILWFVDRLIRFHRGSKTFQIIQIQSTRNFASTRIILQPTEHFNFVAGQYCFINIPNVSPLEWHPFTISSTPLDSQVVFDIKNMGETTWTGRVSDLCKNDERALSSDSPRLPVINVDGPYGGPPKFLHNVVVMVAGGIGITPMISIFRNMYKLNKMRHPEVQRFTNIHLIWVVRKEDTLEMFSESLNEILTDATAKGKFHISIFVTHPTHTVNHFEFDGAEHNIPSLTLALETNKGRPNMLMELREIASSVKHSNLSVAVCGPEGMIEDVKSASYELRLDFHEETFEL